MSREVNGGGQQFFFTIISHIHWTGNHKQIISYMLVCDWGMSPVPANHKQRTFDLLVFDWRTLPMPANQIQGAGLKVTWALLMISRQMTSNTADYHILLRKCIHSLLLFLITLYLLSLSYCYTPYGNIL